YGVIARNTPLLIQLFFLYYGLNEIGLSTLECAILALSFLLVVALFLCCVFIIGVPFFINALFRVQNSLKETYKLATNLSANL
ncbi:hypothetical protein BZK24_08670, partial [Helicobacter pylori]